MCKTKKQIKDIKYQVIGWQDENTLLINCAVTRRNRLIEYVRRLFSIKVYKDG